MDASNSFEVCFIDSGVKRIEDLHLNASVQILNLHSNKIARISGLARLHNIQHLDLSSNHISVMEGLDGLVNLRTLNLACNEIRELVGLKNLRSLVKLNMSYNHIKDVSGLQVIQGKDYRLTQLELYGNNIHSLPHLARSIKGCLNLRCLNLNQDGASNPVCDSRDYRATILIALPSLQSLDGLDRNGKPAVVQEVLPDIPGLEQYMDYLISSESSEVNPLSVVTPQIDAALEAFRQRGASTPDATLTASSTLHSDTDKRHCGTSEGPQKPKSEVTDQEMRLLRLEDQLSKLLMSQQQTARCQEISIPKDSAHSPSASHLFTAKRDIDVTDESDDESLTEQQQQAAHGKISAVTARRLAESKQAVRGNTVLKSSSRSSVPSKSARKRSSSPTRKSDKSQRDEAKRADIEDTYVNMMKELEVERERRWKAEQAVKKLAEHIQELRSKANEDENVQSVAVEATSRLKQALSNEREARLRCQAELQLAQEELASVKTKNAEHQNDVEDLQKALHTLESTASNAQRENLKQQAHQAKRQQEAELRVAALVRETELIKASNKNAKQQIQQLQELLANREQEHRDELSKRFTIDSPKMQEAIRREVGQVEKAHAFELTQQKEKVDILSKQYTDLEDEFREALLHEESRFKQVQEAFERLSEEHALNKRALVVAEEKDSKSSSIITELTAMVKEQKGRISELLKAKQEQTSDMKERLQVQESHLEEARRRMVQLELLKKEKVKLESQLQAQESVIEGLKAERRLWGEELAQQGSSLAQDRGRLEAKIESQASDITSLKKQLEREGDAVRIKSKMIEDQTETIRKLKEALIERDVEVKKCREATINIQKDLEDQLATETAVNQDLHEQVERLNERKKELKLQVTDLEEQVEGSRQSHSNLNRKWKEKSTLIGQLEQQVTQMRDAWSTKEKKLAEERDRALNAASVAVEKLKKMDDGFRHQLSSAEEKYQQELHRMVEEKDSAVQLANQRVLEVEEEMRQLLRETVQSKKHMEDKVKRLNQAFSDLQHDL